MIEKHFTLSRNLEGIDQKASIEPNELRDLIRNIREAIDSIGSSMKSMSNEEENTSHALRRSIVASKDLSKYKIIKKNDLTLMRPGNGLDSSNLSLLVGKKLNKQKKKFDQLKLTDVN